MEAFLQIHRFRADDLNGSFEDPLSARIDEINVSFFIFSMICFASARPLVDLFPPSKAFSQCLPHGPF
jgi:hypothetical protein